jgi:hypothetical protein
LLLLLLLLLLDVAAAADVIQEDLITKRMVVGFLGFCFVL